MKSMSPWKLFGIIVAGVLVAQILFCSGCALISNTKMPPLTDEDRKRAKFEELQKQETADEWKKYEKEKMKRWEESHGEIKP